MKNRLFFDTEFIEDGKTIELISIGIVHEYGHHALHLVNVDCDLTRADPWVTEHVVSKLPPRSHPDSNWVTRAEMRSQIAAFVEETARWTPGKVEFWGYYADYDWVAFAQIWGRMVDLPAWSPKYSMDLKQYAVERGNRQLPKPAPAREHHALADAEAVRLGFHMLESQLCPRVGPPVGITAPGWCRSPFLDTPLEIVPLELERYVRNNR